MTAEVRDEMFAHALGEVPSEACGLTSAESPDGVVDGFHPIRNVAATPDRFELDGAEMLTAEAEVDGAGRSVVGVMHSHVDTTAYPSPTDVAAIERFDPSATLLHLIVSLRHAEPVMRAYKVSGQQITEVRIVIDSVEWPGADDGASSAAAVVQALPPPKSD